MELEKIPEVTMDSGHGDHDDRGFYGPEEEGDNNFLTVELIAKHLEDNYIVKVNKTRKKMSDNPWPGRGSMYPNQLLFYSRHSNSLDSAPGTVRGVTMYYLYGKTLAATLATRLSKFMGNNDRGPVYAVGAQSMLVLREAKAAGTKYLILAEVGFHDNPIDAKLLVEKRAEIAKIEAETIAEHLKLKKKTAPKPTPVPVPPVVTPKPPASVPTPGLDKAQQWAVDLGIIADRDWDKNLTKSQLAWILFDYNRKGVK